MHTPRKRFGQHFLKDPAAVRRILDAIEPRRHDHMLEIGPGQGVLTEQLLHHVTHLNAVEVDTELAALLQHRFTPQQLTLFRTDILKFDLGQLRGRQAGTLRVVGNLPYNISTPILFRLVRFIADIQDCHLLLQKEVVQRMVATPDNKTYGRLSVMCQYYFQADSLFDIGPKAFRPAPKVVSTFVRLRPANHSGLVLDSSTDFSTLVRTAFSQRRKTLANALKKLLDPKQIRHAGIDPAVRAETLRLEQFVALANQLTQARFDSR